MQKRYFLSTGLLMLAGCGQAADAVPPKNAATASKVAVPRFDIAGVAVGDKLAAATAVLRQHGFEISVDRGGWTFDDWVEKARAEAAGHFPNPKADGPLRLHARKGVEYLYAELTPMPDGPMLESIHYKAPANGRPPAELAASVIGRYGGGAQVQTRMRRICVISEPDCLKSNPQQNYVQFSTRDQLGISLLAGLRQRAIWKSEFDAGLRRRLGSVPSSF